jgi:hypothetical protein
MVLFDLGRTLEADGVLRPGALETLQGIADLRSGGRPAVLLGLLSDFDMPADPTEIPGIRRRYYAILDALGIRGFFEPLDRRVTLSTEVGVYKPAPAMFRAAVAKAEPTLTFDDVLFVTEDGQHVRAARDLGLRAVRMSRPGRVDGEVAELPDLLPIVQELVLGADDRRRLRPHDAEVAEGAWTVLGDEVVVSGGPEPVGSMSGTGSAAGSAVRRVHSVPSAERLHLVTQNGRLFQAEHPDVPVLVDKGRYLVVELDPADAQRVGEAGGACWSVRPLPGDAVVLAAPPTTVEPPGLVPPEVQQCVDALSPEDFAAHLQSLTAHRTRHSGSEGFDAVAVWAAERLAAAGFAVRTQAVPDGGPRCRNVVGDRPGGGPAPRDVVLVTAHLDSINLRGADAPAPGADDNASGSAGVLALAEALRDHATTLDLRLILFGGEEQGLFGSRRYVADLPGPERARIRAVVNMDMIASRNVPAPGVLLEGAAVSSHVLDDLARAAATFTDLAVTVSFSPANSDHVPFIRSGIPAVLTIEGADGTNERVHTAADTLEFIDRDLAVDILRMNVAYVAETLMDA